MRAIIIDPFRRSVLETEIDGSVASLREALSCDCMQIAHEFETGDILYVDEDGIARGIDALRGMEAEERAHAFDVGAHQSFLGRGVILGPEDGEGRHTDAVIHTSRLSGIIFLAPDIEPAEGVAQTWNAE